MYRKTILENGIRVVTEKVPEMRSIAIGIMVDAGPQDETPEQSGLAHLVEHLIFQGTGSRDAKQIGRFMDSAGGNFGAFTTRDYTIFYATVLDDHRTYALELLGDIFLNSIFPAESLEIEKNAILQEIELGRDSPEERLNTLLKKHSWSSHPLGRPTAGNPEILKGLTREDAIYFFYENYLPDRIIISASGNVDHDDFVAQVRDSFWRMLGASPPRNRPPLVHQGGVVIEHMPVSQVYFSIGLKAYPYANPDRYGMHIMNNILGGGISSRLFRHIRDQRGMVYQIGSEYHAYRDG
ncbi:MAG: pitrilysin family protein, partial [Chloroflexota bacterium]